MTGGLNPGRESVLVIGAGLQGATVALALAERGVRSVLLDRLDAPMSGASVRNEGKIHLGFVYALDRTGGTTSHQVEGALAFSPLIERWCGEVEWAANRSGGFNYVVMNDGLAGPDELGSHYDQVCAEIERAVDGSESNYLGEPVLPRVSRGRGPVPGLAAGIADAWFETPERSVDPRFLRHVVTRALTAEPLVEVLPGRRVDSAVRTDNGFRLEVSTADGTEVHEASRVINCCWEGRQELDIQVLGEAEPQCYRIKHHVLVRGETGEGIHPTTMVQGPYGDVVPWPNGDVYISWYPVARTYFGSAPEPDPQPDAGVARATLAELSDRIPGLRGFRVVGHGPAQIVAPARSDIDDRDSGLHSRTAPGVRGVGGWWSLSGGKLTTAPLASERCAAQITDTPVGL